MIYATRLVTPSQTRFRQTTPQTQPQHAQSMPTQTTQQNQQKTQQSADETKHFVSYFLADAFAILLGCSIVDAGTHTVLRTMEKREARDFTMEKIKTNHKDKYEEIENQTKSIVANLDALSDNNDAQKLSQAIKKSYNKYFNADLSIDKDHKPEKKDIKEVAKNMESLEKNITELFVKIDDKESYASVARPFIKTLKKAQKQIK